MINRGVVHCDANIYCPANTTNGDFSLIFRAEWLHWSQEGRGREDCTDQRNLSSPQLFNLADLSWKYFRQAGEKIFFHWKILFLTFYRCPPAWSGDSEQSSCWRHHLPAGRSTEDSKGVRANNLTLQSITRDHGGCRAKSQNFIFPSFSAGEIGNF